MLLSGGLDSTIIAYLAKKIFKNTIAITCVFLNEKDFKKFKKFKKIEINKYMDLRNAKKISKKLGIKFDPLILPLNHIKKDLVKTVHCIIFKTGGILIYIVEV